MKLQLVSSQEDLSSLKKELEEEKQKQEKTKVCLRDLRKEVEVMRETHMKEKEAWSQEKDQLLEELNALKDQSRTETTQDLDRVRQSLLAGSPAEEDGYYSEAVLVCVNHSLTLIYANLLLLISAIIRTIYSIPII